jgi:hypothetical protein
MYTYSYNINPPVPTGFSIFHTASKGRTRPTLVTNPKRANARHKFSQSNELLGHIWTLAHNVSHDQTSQNRPMILIYPG